MNFKAPAKLRIEKGKFVLDFQEKVIDIEYVGWISSYIDKILEHLPREYRPLTEDDLLLIMDDDGNCYLEIKEVRNIAKSWEGSAINSYTTEDPIYREEIELLEGKMILHFYRKEE